MPDLIRSAKRHTTNVEPSGGRFAQPGSRDLKAFVLRPEDVAEAVLYAVCLPETVHINEIMIRPSQQLQMPGMRLPA